MKDYKYLVFRVYTEKERPAASSSERIVFYGWTRNKSVLKAFLEQRTKGKYKFKKLYDEDIAYYYSEDITDESTMIDILELHFSKTGETAKMFMTAKEMKEGEKAIQRMFREQASTFKCSEDGSKWVYLNMFVNLIDYYAEALDFLGYRPPELNNLEDTLVASEEDEVEEMIEMAYNGVFDHPEEVYEPDYKPKGLSAIGDVAHKILYSVESFVKALREDL